LNSLATVIDKNKRNAADNSVKVVHPCPCPKQTNFLANFYPHYKLYTKTQMSGPGFK